MLNDDKKGATNTVSKFQDLLNNHGFQYNYMEKTSP